MWELVFILILIILVGLYIIWNLMKKNEFVETWIEIFTNKVLDVQRQIHEIDSTGHFEADDEVGTIFDGLKEIIDDLTNFTEKELLSDENDEE